jgi:gamma-glutamylcyclotransferase (GGCT)/AIG2-like uncharacterized protein YtfP
LTEPARFKSVTGVGYASVTDGNPPAAGPYAVAARLADFAAIRGDGYLYAVPQAGASIVGRLICRVSDEAFHHLDAYEGPGYRREALAVRTDEGLLDAYVYLSTS